MSSRSAEQAVSDVTLADKVAFLKRQEIYPDHPGSVDVVETHMSWVFLTDRHVYKLKKPVRYDFLDFSTCEARRRHCEAEIRLNRRLAADVYLGTISLTLDSGEGLQLGGSGQVVDWLVHMRRLPRQRMLDQVIAERSLTKAEVRSVATQLSLFYKHQPPVEIEAAAYGDRFRSDIEATHDDLSDAKYQLPEGLIKIASKAQTDFLEDRAGLFDDRVRQGRLIEAHGDLRAEHICLESKPVIIDCLEFNRDFRILDPADELAFLALDCERLGAPWIRDLLFTTYNEVTGDIPVNALCDFYTSYRACLRAKIAVWHLKEPDVRDVRKWRRLGRQLLEIGAHYAQRLC